MKKLVIFILVAFSLFSMVACGSSKDINKGISIEPNDTAEAGPYVNYDYEDKDVRDEAIHRQEYMLRLSEKPIFDEPGEFWLPPEDFLTEEEKEFRSQVIEAAELDKNSPDFEEQLIKLYTATDSTDYPNYETYKLFINRLK